MNAASFFTVGGHIIETILDGPEYSGGGYEATIADSKRQAKEDKVLLKQSHKSAIELADEIVGDSYNVKRGIKGAEKSRQGGLLVRRGLTIAAALAAMDGPLPFGDVAAAVFLVGGGAYMIYSGSKDIIQK